MFFKANLFVNFYKTHTNSVNLIILVIVTIMTFYNSLRCYYFEADDFNVMLQSKRSFVTTLVTNTWGLESGGNYRPMEVFSHLFDLNIYGDVNPLGRRITNLLFHLSNVVLVYFLSIYLTQKKSIGVVSSLLFSTQIIHSYSLTTCYMDYWKGGPNSYIFLFINYNTVFEI